MAEVPVKSKEIIQDDLFNPTKQSAKELIEILDVLKISFSKITAETKKISSDSKSFANADQINKVTEALQKQEGVRKVVQKTEEQLAKARIRDAERKARDAKALDVQRQKAIKATERENSAYMKMSDSLAKLRKQYKDVAASQGENSRAARLLLKELTPLDAKIKSIDASSGQFNRNVGNYPRIFGLATSAVTKLAGAFGLFFGLRAVVGIFRDAVGTFRDFEDTNVRVASVLGTTTENTKELTADAERLGATTARSAVEVLKLQEAYARLGFTQKEILNLTEPTINGSIALNAELSETAELTGAVVNSFDEFSSIDAPDILDKMTLSTQRSALNFAKLQTQLPIVGAAANAAGVGFDELLSLLGKLSDAGLDASTSATSLRNIFIESASQGKPYTELLDKIAASTDALVDSNDEFGKRGAVAATILSKQTEEAKALEKELKNAGGTAERVAKENLKTLTGAITLLKSAYEGFILSLEKGDGSFAKSLQTITRVVTELLSFATGTQKAKSELDEFELRIRNIAETFINVGKTIGAVIAGYVAYRTAVVTTNVVLRISNTLTKAQVFQQSILTTVTNLATKAQERFNAAQKANVIGIIVSLLAAAASAMFLFKKKVDDANESTREFNDTLSETDVILGNVAGLKKRIDTISQLSKESLRTLKSDIEAEIDALQKAEDEKLGAATQTNKIITTLENQKKNEIDLIRQEELRQAIEINKTQLLNEKGTIEAIRQARESLAIQIREINKRLGAAAKREIESFEREFRESQARLIEDERTRLIEQEKLRFEFAQKDLQAKREKAIEEGKDVKFFNELIQSLEIEHQKALLKIKEEYAEKQRKILEDTQNFIIEQMRQYEDAEIINLEAQLLKIKDVTTKEYKDLQERIIRLKIEQLEAEKRLVLENLEITEAERVKRIAELNYEIAVLNNKALETEAKKERDHYRQGTDQLKATLEERNNLKQRFYELETQERDRQIQIQSDRAAAGLTNQLAFEEATQKKAAQERKEQLKKEARQREAIALSETFINSLNANLKAGDSAGVASGKALATTFAAKGIVKGLQFFEEGTEYVTQKGGKSPFSKGKDTVDAVLSVGEAVATREANAKYRGVVGAMNQGIFHELYTPKKVVANTMENMAANILLQQQMEANHLLRRIASKPTQTVEFDNFGNIVETVYKDSRKETTTYKTALSKFRK